MSYLSQGCGRISLCALLTVLGLCTSAAVLAAPVCARPAAAAPQLARLTQVMASGRYVAYQPTQIRVINGLASRADESGIAADLTVLRPRFDGLITYSVGNGADRVVDVAARLGFRAVILGIWNIDDEQELSLAQAAITRHPRLVVGLSLGNERVLAGVTDMALLAQRLQRLRARLPGLPLTSTEPFHLWLQPAAVPVLRNADFLLANVHPAFQPWFREADDFNAAKFVVNVTAQLSAAFCGPVLVKETGVPTAPAAMGFTPQRQAGVYKSLKNQFIPDEHRAFAWFSAFDAPWRVNDSHPTAGPQPQEGSWGLYTEDRKPKLVISQLPLLGR
jgi:exo-beta-1,3-glucanase (GH17 family)